MERGIVVPGMRSWVQGVLAMLVLLGVWLQCLSNEATKMLQRAHGNVTMVARCAGYGVTPVASTVGWWGARGLTVLI